ncbi:MAG: transposase family protein [Sphingobacteriales bacterium]|nr:transposase family protein [Sphingobacteriales bacterium]
MPGKKSAGKYVEHNQLNPSHPFEVIEIDVKYIYIRGERRNAYLITLLDTFSRIAISWDLQFSIKHTHAKRLIKENQ